MHVIICRDAQEVGVVAARYVAESLRAADHPVLGLATGSSPLGLYEELARMVREDELDLSDAQGFALDEYVGLAVDHPESYHSVIRRTVVEPLAMDPERVHVPDGLAEDVAAAAAEYDARIEAAGGIDVQILGIGANGHIGFNEPFTSFGATTHEVPLTARTREDNARFFDSIDEVPTHAVSQGPATIMRSRRAVLVAQGEGKADAIAAMVEGAVSHVCPASLLQFHPDAIVVVDEAAASKLQLREHFQTP
ncbi:glucosamine-6-phosphate deaminase [uncultured Tessaracoccus sp.]|uniref:glucosamine-6-phosphate deaminase n=1 Tax=uncultured Tessaracoccus sp. TaxID=905023 RepID=UPI0025E41FF4|nr:glucosamine-6-phosphate deaminase [uncultured Tessaracoccus sp.]